MIYCALICYFLITLQPQCSTPDNGLWLGLTDKINEGSFLWESTQLGLTYYAWTQGQPDNANGVQDCVHMWCWNNNGEWDDDYCDDVNQNTLCEVSIPCPQPKSNFSNTFCQILNQSKRKKTKEPIEFHTVYCFFKNKIFLLFNNLF
jgi:hypothetical protein